jgi:hypothetical protein
MDGCAAESWASQSKAFNQLLHLSGEHATSTLWIGLASQACETIASISAEPALEPPKLQTMLARHLRQWHAILQTGPQHAEPIQSKLTG